MLKASGTTILSRGDANLGDGVMTSKTCAFRTESQVSKMEQPAWLAGSAGAVRARSRG